MHQKYNVLSNDRLCKKKEKEKKSSDIDLTNLDNYLLLNIWSLLKKAFLGQKYISIRPSTAI